MNRLLAYDSVRSQLIQSSPESESKAQLLEELKSMVESLQMENLLKQQAIETASRLVRELSHEVTVAVMQNAVLKQKQEVMSTENTEMLDLLNTLVQRLDLPTGESQQRNMKHKKTNQQQSFIDRQHKQARSSSKCQVRNAQKQKLKNRFRNFLSISTSFSEASPQTFNQSCQSDVLQEWQQSNENDLSIANRSSNNYGKDKYKVSKEVTELRRRLDKAQKQVQELTLASQMKEERYLQVLESFGRRIQ